MNPYFKGQRLKLLRRAYHLTQAELARLVGLTSPDHIARLETGKREPSRDVLLKLKLIFDKPEEELVPGVVAEVIDTLWYATHELKNLVLGKSDPKSKRKLELLDAIISRLALRQHQSGL